MNKHKFENPKADVILKDEEAVIYLNYLKDKGYDSIDELVKKYKNEVQETTDRLKYLRVSYRMEQGINNDIKEVLYGLSSRLSLYRVYGYELHMRRERYVQVAIAYISKNQADIERIHKLFADVIKDKANELASEAIEERQKLCDEDNRLTKLEYKLKLSKWEKTFWRRVFKKLFMKKKT